MEDEFALFALLGQFDKGTNNILTRFLYSIQNPEFLFDINKSAAVSNSLTVVAQTLIDGCSTTESDPLLAQAQSTSKVLFSKSVHNNFREWVQSYFQEVQIREEIPRDDFIHFLRVITSFSRAYK